MKYSSSYQQKACTVRKHIWRSNWKYTQPNMSSLELVLEVSRHAKFLTLPEARQRNWYRWWWRWSSPPWDLNLWQEPTNTHASKSSSDECRIHPVSSSIWRAERHGWLLILTTVIIIGSPQNVIGNYEGPYITLVARDPGPSLKSWESGTCSELSSCSTTDSAFFLESTAFFTALGTAMCKICTIIIKGVISLDPQA